MMEHESTLRDFNLFLSSEAIFGILEALYELVGDIPENEPELTEFYAKLSGLSGVESYLPGISESFSNACLICVGSL